MTSLRWQGFGGLDLRLVRNLRFAAVSGGAGGSGIADMLDELGNPGRRMQANEGLSYEASAGNSW
jgi:hypothetical protein